MDSARREAGWRRHRRLGVPRCVRFAFRRREYRRRGEMGDNNNVGAAWVFTRSAGVWSQLGEKLVGAGAVDPAYQGAVSIADDSDTLAVGGSGDNNNVGAAWIFTPTFAGT